MGKLAQQLGGQSQVKVYGGGKLAERNEPRSEERKAAKMSAKAHAKAEKAEGHACGMSKRGCK